MKLMQDQPILNDLTDATIQKPGLAEKAAGIMNDPTATLSGWKQWLVDKSPLLVEWAFEIVGVFLLLFIAWLVARWLSRMTTRALTKAKIDLTLVRFFAKLVKWSIMLFAIMACLGQFGFEMTSFAAVIAAAGFAIGLAFQGSLSNFSAGIMLLVFRPFKVGDVVNVAGTSGKVFEIELFTTAIDTFDNRRFIVPNSAIFGATIENVSYHGTRRVDVNVGASYDADIDATRAALKSAIETIENRIDEPESVVVLKELGASSVDWTVRVWVKASDYWPTKEALTRAVKMKLDDAGIGIPYPQMDVH
ncbi:MAG: mechanosensitive ion channel, partial [Phycisphaerales bacterium]|nr:mechanosensitive ion channel [Phycisphaerales bacterium]